MNELFGTFWGSNHLLTEDAVHEAASWGYTYPDSLADELRVYTNVSRKDKQADQRPMSEKAFHAVLERVKAYAIASNRHLNLPYHNEKHFREFATSALLLFDAIHGKEAKRSMLAARQAVEIAGWLHDCHHMGCTLRFDYNEADYSDRPDYASGIYGLFMEKEFGREVSTEYVSAYAANQLLETLGLPVPWRVFIVQLIWATTFGGQQAVARGITGTPALSNPSNIYFALMRTADIWYPKTLHQSLNEAYDVCVLECPADGRIAAEDACGFIRGRIGYLGYRLSTMKHLDSRAKLLTGIKSVTREGQTYAESDRQACLLSLAGENSYVLDYVKKLMV